MINKDSIISLSIATMLGLGLSVPSVCYADTIRKVESIEVTMFLEKSGMATVHDHIAYFVKNGTMVVLTFKV